MKIDLDVMFICVGWLLLVQAYVDAIHVNKSNVCQQGDGYNTTCSSQLHGKYCSFEVQKNSSSCHLKSFMLERGSQYLGSVEVAAYCYISKAYTLSALNVSMKNIKWKEMDLRFRFCEHNFHICASVRLDDEAEHLFYDCVLTDKFDIGHKVMQLEYMANDGEAFQGGLYNFIPPNCYDSDKPCKKRLIYFEETSHTELTLHIQKLPSDINITNITIFVLLKCSVKCGTKMDRVNCTKDECSVYKVISVTPSAEEILETIDISADRGCFYLSLQYNNGPMDVCLAYTPIISKNETFLSPTVGALGSLAALVILTVLTYLFRKRCKAKLITHEDCSTPTLLLIHNPVHRLHAKVVIELADFLSTHCGVNVLLDLKDISKSQYKDPLFWYSTAVSSASCIAVVSTPPCSGAGDAVFHNLHSIGLRYTKEQLRIHSSKMLIFGILLSYCSRKHIAAEIQNLRCFKIMDDFVSFVCFIHGYKPHWINRYITVHQTLVCRIRHALRTSGDRLNCAIRDMTFELSSCCNEYQSTESDRYQLILLKENVEVSNMVSDLHVSESSQLQNLNDMVNMTELDLHTENLHSGKEYTNCEFVVNGDSLIL